MDPRNPKGVNEAIQNIEKLFDERTVIKSNTYNRQLSQQEQLRLINIRQGIFASLDTLKDALD